MGCFLACFGSVNGKRRKPGKKALSRDRSYRNYASLHPSSPLKQEATAETAVSSLLESREKQEDLSFNGRKKVTFDLNVKTYKAELSTQEVNNYSSENEEEKKREKEDKKVGKEKEPNLSEDNSTNSSSGSYPPNHRYENCASSEDEAEYEDSDFDDDDDNDEEDNESDDEEDTGGEESFDSYFSLPKEKKASGQLANEEVNDARPICGSPDRKSTLLANGNARDRSQYIHSVLNPVENLSQWKAVKAKPTQLKHPKKENVDLEPELHISFSAEPTFKPVKYQKSINSSPSFNVTKPSAKQEISVDTSLSNWLVSSETTPSIKTSVARTESTEYSKSPASYSSKNKEDRPILGALTLEEIRQSLASSPRRSPSQSPEEIPIVGTVGSYWNHNNMAVDSSPSQRSGSDAKGIPNTTSKYREDKRVNWHSTPFEVRLERALTKDDVEAYSSNPTRAC